MAFGVDDALLIAAIASMVGSTGAGAAKTMQTKKYERESKEYEKREKAKADKEARRAALARAIGANQEYTPKKGEEPPEVPDTSGADIAGQISSLLGQAAATGLSAGVGAPKAGAVPPPAIKPQIQRVPQYNPYGKPGPGGSLWG